MKKNHNNFNIQLEVEKESYLLEYLLFNISNKSKNNIKSLLVRGNVLVDEKVITQYNYKLIPGQKVSIKTSKIYNTQFKEIIDIIYEDDDIIVINKPSGLLTIATNLEKQNTAYHIVMNYLKRNNYKNKIFVIHRLDRDTSGILMFAKNEKVKMAFQNNWDDLVLLRNYVAVVEGKIKDESGTIKSWLRETKTLLVYSSYTKDDGKLAITHYKKITENNKYTLLDIKIDTGRKNQIRVHMKDIGNNIIGDKKYGAKLDPLKRLGLHANILEVKHPFTKEIMHFEAKIPSDLMSLFR